MASSAVYGLLIACSLPSSLLPQLPTAAASGRVYAAAARTPRSNILHRLGVAFCQEIFHCSTRKRIYSPDQPVRTIAGCCNRRHTLWYAILRCDLETKKYCNNQCRGCWEPPKKTLKREDLPNLCLVQVCAKRGTNNA